MRSLMQKLAVFCIFLGLETISSLDSGACLTNEAKSGRCVDINLCPFLRDLAKAAVVSKYEKMTLNKRVCGEMKVCCEEHLIALSHQQTSIIPTSVTRKPIESRPQTSTPTPGKKMILPNTTVCGLDVSGKITGGETTEIDQFPWAVVLEYRNEDIPIVICGGSLINIRYVITAAHCVTQFMKEDLIVRLGEYDLESNPDCYPQETGYCNPEVIKSEVDQVKVQSKLKRRQNDIALLKLKQTLPEDYYDHVQPICLPQSEDLMNDLFINRNVSVTGWGGNETEFRSRLKMHANLVTISMDECRCEYQLAGIKQKLNDTHICAKSPSGLIQDTCRGDSGGPLMISVRGNWYLIGVVSFGTTCSRATVPGVYTRVTSFMDWIEENLVD